MANFENVTNAWDAAGDWFSDFGKNVGSVGSRQELVK